MVLVSELVKESFCHVADISSSMVDKNREKKGMNEKEADLEGNVSYGMEKSAQILLK